MTAKSHYFKIENKIFWVSFFIILIVGILTLIFLKVFKINTTLTPLHAQVKDAIALRVMKNPQHLSPELWYKENVPHPGSPQTLAIDGYQAIRDGRTVYVSAANLASDKVYSNIYLISYNEGAKEETVKIYNQLLNNWSFNSNLSDSGAGSVCSNNLTTACASNKDCPPNETCLNMEAKAKLTRDTKRLADLQDLRQNLTDYNYQQGSYPTLSSGTYQPNISFSVWPSWQKTLGQDLTSSLPQDPINRFYGCADPYDPTTCWDNQALKFSCPQNYYIYAYQSPTKTGDQAKVYTKLEYTDKLWDSTLDILINPEELLAACNLNFGQNANDYDNDAIADKEDNCPTIGNPLQTDADSDKLGDACDACPNDPLNDQDNDGYCVNLANPIFGNKKDNDNCPTVYNPSQKENPDIPGVGLACSVCQDADYDSFCSFATGGDDCNDNNQAIHPGAPELPNGLDDNCNGKVDECENSLNIRIFQGTTIDKAAPALSLSKDAVSLYNLSGPGQGCSDMTDFDFHPADGKSDFIEAQKSNLFIYHNKINNRMYLGFLHNIREGAMEGSASFDLKGIPNDAKFVVRDDFDPASTSEYRESEINYSLSGVSWKWLNNTDGAMIDLGPATRGWKIIITPKDFSGIDSWRMPYDVGGGNIGYIDLNMNQAVTLEYDSTSKITKSVPCYTGSPGTLGVGICKAGSAICNGSVWGQCKGQILPQIEKCDATELDQDCDGNPDNGCDADGDGFCALGSSCTGAYAACPNGCCDTDDNNANFPPQQYQCLIINNRCECTLTYSEQPEWGQGIGINIRQPSDQLEVKSLTTPYLWVASSDTDEVYRVDTINNTIKGPYAVGDNPSRTAVGIDDDVWVANRGDTSQNFNSTINHLKTKSDGTIEYNISYPVGTKPRALAISIEGENKYVWVGNYGDVNIADGSALNNGTIYKLNYDTGELLQVINTNNCPYGAAVDGLGNVWVAYNDGCKANNYIDKIDLSNPANPQLIHSQPVSAYGFTIDKNSNVWVADIVDNKIFELNQQGIKIATIDVTTIGRPRGIAADRYNYIYVTHDLVGKVSQIRNGVIWNNVNSDEGGTNGVPIGITATADGFIWVINRATAHICKFNSNLNMIDLIPGPGINCLQVGSYPYTYSDMAGYILRAITLRGGNWTVNIDSHTNNPVWQNLIWSETESTDSYARIKTRSAATETELESASWSDYYDTSPADISNTPQKRWLQIQVDLHLSWDDQSPAIDNLKVEVSY